MTSTMTTGKQQSFPVKRNWLLIISADETMNYSFDDIPGKKFSYIIIKYFPNYVENNELISAIKEQKCF